MAPVRRAVTLATVVLLGALTACTPDSAPPPAPTGTELAPVPGIVAPRSDFPASTRAATGYDSIFDLASAGSAAVAVGFVYAGRVVPTFRYSADSGRTWAQGSLDAPSLAAMVAGRQEFPLHVTALRGGFVAVGSSDRESLVRTSEDGRAWRRHVVDPTVMNTDLDSVSAVTQTTTGLLAVGQRKAYGEQPRAMSWRSTDGLRWSRAPLGGVGRGEGVAVRGSVTVAVGETPDGNDQRAWRSRDGGASWEKVRVPRAAGDDDFSRSLADVAATRSGFVAVGTVYRREYQPTVYRSRDGRRWTSEKASRLASSASTFGSRVATSGNRTLLVTSENKPYDTPLMWTPRGSGWAEARTPLFRERERSGGAAWSVFDIAPTPDGWLVVAGRSDDEPFETQIWRSDDAGRNFQKSTVPRARENSPAVFPNVVVATQPSVVVVGNSQRNPSRWVSADGRTFGPPTSLTTDPRLDLTGATSHDGQLLAYGTRKVRNGDAVIWRGPTAGGVSTSAPWTFGRDNRYSSNSVHSVRWLRGRWWAVGNKSDNGNVNDSAWVASSTDGIRWTQRRAATMYRKKNDRAEIYFDITDLQGDHDIGRYASDIAETSTGMLAVGWVTDDALRTAFPAVWRSSDLRRWKLARLPYAGYAGGRADSVTSKGSVTVVIGQVRRRGSEVALPYLWTSVDGGRVWKGQVMAVPGRDSSLDSVIISGARFVLTGTTGDDPAKPVAWTSADGVSWAPMPWTGFPIDPAAEVTVADIAADGEDVVGLATTTNAAGTGTVLFRQRIG